MPLASALRRHVRRLPIAWGTPSQHALAHPHHTLPCRPGVMPQRRSCATATRDLEERIQQRLQPIPSPYKGEHFTDYDDLQIVWETREKRYSCVDRVNYEFHMWSLREMLHCVRDGRPPLALSSAYTAYLALWGGAMQSTHPALHPVMQQLAQFLAAHGVVLMSCATLLSTPLFFMISLRINRAVGDRWWEGRALFGRILANAHNLANSAQLYISDRATVIEVGVLSAALVKGVEYHLRCLDSDSQAQAFHRMLTAGQLRVLSHAGHHPHGMVELLMRQLGDAHVQGHVHNVRCLIAMQQLLQDIVLDLQSLHQLTHTPEPWAYQKHLRLSILVWLGLLPACLVPYLGLWAVPTGACMGYGLFKMDHVSVELQNPFGMDYTDHHLSQLTDTMQQQVRNSLLRYVRRSVAA